MSSKRTIRIEADNYTCPLCSNTPEILSIHSDTGYIDLRCPNINHSEISYPLIQYLSKESKCININVKCGICGKYQKDFEKIFHYCYDCKIDICPECLSDETKHKISHKQLISIKIKSLKCLKHFKEKEFETFCLDCEENICEKEKKKHEHHQFYKIKDFQSEMEKKIKIIREKNKLLKLIVLMNEIIIRSYKIFPNNYYHCKSLINIAKNIEKENGRDTTILEASLNNLQNKFDYQKKALNELSSKLRIELKGDETELNLSEKNLTDKEVELFSDITFPKLKKIDFSYNNINNINPLSNLMAPFLEQIDFEHNNIEDISVLKQLDKNCPKIKILNFKNNHIKDIQILKELVFNSLQKINLINNDLTNELNNYKDILDKYKNKIEYKPVTQEEFKKKYTKDINFNSREIYIDKKNLENEGLHSLLLVNMDFYNLKKLFLTNCQISKIDILVSQKMNKLTDLTLNENKIKDISCLKDVNFPELQVLLLNNNLITKIDVFKPLSFPKLSKLGLENNKIRNAKRNEDIVNYLINEKKVNVIINYV